MKKYPNLSDYHLHSHFSSDSEENPKRIIEKACELGLRSICFTDHIDFDYPPCEDYENPAFVFDADKYFEELNMIRDNYRSLSAGTVDPTVKPLNVRIGVELGQMPYLADKNNAFANSHPFDFVIASTHLIDGMDPYYASFWEDKDYNQVIRRYYEYTLDCVNAYSNYDVYGHIDYVTRYTPKFIDKAHTKPFIYDIRKDMEVIEAILKKIISDGHGIEINSGALAKGLSSPNPSYEVIKLYKDLGGEIITMGSDAHVASNIAFGFDITRQILLSAGFKYYAEFENRKIVNFVNLKKNDSC